MRVSLCFRSSTRPTSRWRKKKEKRFSRRLGKNFPSSVRRACTAPVTCSWAIWPFGSESRLNIAGRRLMHAATSSTKRRRGRRFGKKDIQRSEQRRGLTAQRGVITAAKQRFRQPDNYRRRK